MKAHVLVVDDDQAMREMLSLRLGKRDFHVITCGSAGEAIELVQRVDVDIVVSDINMKGGTGVELCRRVLEHRPQLPVILITAWGSIQLAVDGIKAGASDFITKPWSNAQLLQSVETALSLAAARASRAKRSDAAGSSAR